ncbi:MAG TPA: methionyl-tRNA formyltransferase [Bryobacteraceae bacterium]|nr:methionyl-tRNA formyltransferase [Bryobacteraceae bacterium]
MEIIFLGTPEFAVPSLKALAGAGHKIQGVFTQPDRPKGRGNQLAASPVKEAASELGFRVLQPERIRRPEQVAALVELKPELMVVVGYGQIIPQAIIDIPAHGILNVHASLLPKYRGAAPIQWAIANGETETGVTIMRIDAGLDTGAMLAQNSLTIDPEETAPELSKRLAEAGAQLLLKSIKRIENGAAVYTPQDNTRATYAPVLKKEDGRIDWSLPASVIHNRLRGFTPWPGAYTTFRSQTLRIYDAYPLVRQSSDEPGTLESEKRTLRVICGHNSALELKEIQLEGKKRVGVDAFLNGHNMERGERLGG